MKHFNQTKLVEITNEDKQAVIRMYFFNSLNFKI